MKTKIFVIFTLLIIIEGFLSGCTETNNGLSSEEERFVGTWEPNNEDFPLPIFLNFSSDRVFTQGPIQRNWEVKDGKLILTGDVPQETSRYDYYFTEEDTILHLQTEGQNVYIPYTKVTQ